MKDAKTKRREARGTLILGIDRRQIREVFLKEQRRRGNARRQLMVVR